MVGSVCRIVLGAKPFVRVAKAVGMRVLRNHQKRAWVFNIRFSLALRRAPWTADCTYNDTFLLLIEYSSRAKVVMDFTQGGLDLLLYDLFIYLPVYTSRSSCSAGAYGLGVHDTCPFSLRVIL